MNAMNTAELRRLAEAATQLFPDEWHENLGEVVSGEITVSIANGPYENPVIGSQEIAKYQAAANPAAILSLLDRMEAAENVCAKLDAAIMLPFWTVAEANVEMEKFAELIEAWRKAKEGGRDEL